MRHAIRLSDTELGLLQGTGFVLLYAVAGIPLGWVADNMNRRNLIAIGIAVWSVATSAAAFCTSFWPLFLTRIGLGVGEACLIPCAMSLLTAYFVKSELGRGISIFGMGAFLGKGVACCCQSDANSSLHDASRSLSVWPSWRASATPPTRRSVVA